MMMMMMMAVFSEQQQGEEVKRGRRAGKSKSFLHATYNKSHLIRHAVGKEGTLLDCYAPLGNAE